MDVNLGAYLWQQLALAHLRHAVNSGNAQELADARLRCADAGLGPSAIREEIKLHRRRVEGEARQRTS